jgi:hypothetical protein
MNRYIFVGALASLAACSQSEPPPEVTAEVEAPAAQALAADGQPAVGTYRVTTADGEVLMEEVRADGTYVATIDGEVVETGRWEQRSPEEYCYTKDEEGATQQCNTEGIDDQGVWTSRDPEGKVATVERVQT